MHVYMPKWKFCAFVRGYCWRESLKNQWTINVSIDYLLILKHIYLCQFIKLFHASKIFQKIKCCVFIGSQYIIDYYWNRFKYRIVKIKVHVPKKILGRIVSLSGIESFSLWVELSWKPDNKLGVEMYCD